MMDMHQVVQDKDNRTMRAIEIIANELAKHPSIAKSIEKKLRKEFPDEEAPKELKEAMVNRFVTNPKIL